VLFGVCEVTYIEKTLVNYDPVIKQIFIDIKYMLILLLDIEQVEVLGKVKQ
jgi:hypothetical protein